MENNNYPTKESYLRLKALIIIQARMESKRLPGKSMLPLAGKPLLYHVIERCKLIDKAGGIVVATGNRESNLEIVELCEKMSVDVYCGSDDNVLERYYNAAKKYGCNYIVRATGDNPFTDAQYASMAIEIALESGADLTSLQNLPLGTAVEIIKFKALETAYEMSSENYHYEHVTPYIKEHPELFSIQRHPVQIDTPYPNLRLTVDTKSDYNLASIIYNALYKETEFSLDETIEFLRQNPGLVLLNTGVDQRPMTHSEKSNS